MTKYLLATGTSAAEVSWRLGLEGHDTPLGVLVEEPRTVDIAALMRDVERLKRHFEPPRCTFGRYAIIHAPGCPGGNTIT